MFDTLKNSVLLKGKIFLVAAAILSVKLDGFFPDGLF